MDKIISLAKQFEKDLLNHRRYLHQNAEFASHLPLATQLVLNELASLGITATEICPSGIVATIGNHSGKTILLRADMDALPMKEEVDLPYKTTTEYAHTCGHDIHTAMLLTAAKILKQQEDQLEGTVKLMFQPDEEGISGALAMVNAGVLDGVECALAIHVASNLSAGTIYHYSGPMYASADGYKITIQGKGGHGASPHCTIDPINIACHTHIALQALIARETNPRDIAVLTIGSIHGGSVGNIIPETVTMRGTLRTYNDSIRDKLKHRLIDIVESTAKLFQGTATIDFINGTPTVNCDPSFTKEIVQYLENLLPSEQVEVLPCAYTGSEDFAYLGQNIPSTMLILGCAMDDKDLIFDHHNPKVQFNESAFIYGAATYAHCAIQWLKNNH